MTKTTKNKNKNKGRQRNWKRKALSFALVAFLVTAISGSTLTLNQKEAEAGFCIPCLGCWPGDTIISHFTWRFNKWIWEEEVEKIIIDQINSEENWIIQDFFEDYWLKGLAEMTEFLSAFGLYQVEIIGTFFDAKNKLETEQLYFKLQAQAHKDYHPSESFCAFGTNARSLAASESQAKRNKLAMSKTALERHIGAQYVSASGGTDEDKQSRWNQFVKTYCDPKDNNWSTPGTGLDLACDRDGSGGSTATGAQNKSRINRDIDYTALVEEPRTLDINFTNTSNTPDQEDVIALSKNLYGDKALSRILKTKHLSEEGVQKLYIILRSIAAKRNVAENSFNAITSMKAAGTANGSTGPHIAALIKDLMPAGTSNADITNIMGQNPSYYAQLEFLGKKIYQNPGFFANLYDKPTNIKRKSVAMKAIDLMLDRALYESELRQEMMMSVMLSSELRDEYRNVNSELETQKRK